MTLIVGLRGADGVVLAADSQATHDALRHPARKLFVTKSGIAWGTAGPIAGTQILYSEFEHLDLAANPPREKAKEAIERAVKTSADELAPSTGQQQEWFEGLFAWYDEGEERHYLLFARHDGFAEFRPPFGAVGSSGQLGMFGFTRSAFMSYDALQLETTKMLTYMVAEDAVTASARGVDGPIQMAVASRGQTAVLKDDELKSIRDTAAAFQLHQLDFLKRVDDAGGVSPDTGIVPGQSRVGRLRRSSRKRKDS